MILAIKFGEGGEGETDQRSATHSCSFSLCVPNPVDLQQATSYHGENLRGFGQFGTPAAFFLDLDGGLIFLPVLHPEDGPAVSAHDEAGTLFIDPVRTLSADLDFEFRSI